MKDMIHDALVLFLITIIAGAALGVIYFVTKEPIRIAEEEKLKNAYSEVFENAESFTDVSEDISISDLKLWNAEGYGNVNIDSTMLAYDSDKNTIGYVLLITTKEGYGGEISFSMGITREGLLNGISILNISETAGLGMRASEVLVPQYKDKQVLSFEITKNKATSDVQIDAISSATITSKAINNAVNAGLYYYQNELGGGAYEK